MPRAAKKPIVVEPEKKQEEMETLSLDLQSSSLEAQALQQLTPHMVKVLKKIAYYTSKVGLTLKESCILCDVDFERFEEEMKVTPIIGKVIRVKELEYKKDLMYTISQKAKSGDDKLAQWLLERRYSDEFGSKKAGSSSDDDGDLFYQAIQIIRKKGDNTSLVNLESGKAIVVTKNLPSGNAPSKDHNERIAQILNNG